MKGIRGLPLSGREVQVLDLLADGQECAEVAENLRLAHASVKNYATRVYAKLGARNRAHAVRLAYRGGLFVPDDVIEFPIAVEPANPGMITLPVSVVEELANVAKSTARGRLDGMLQQQAARAALSVQPFQKQAASKQGAAR